MDRKRIAPGDRPTFPLCPSCGGKGMRVSESRSGRYAATKCRWCFGIGAIDPAMMTLYVRWLRLSNFGRLHERCGRFGELRRTGVLRGG